MYDIIGDIHGHYDKLEALLLKLDYTPKGQGWLPPDGRKALFLGDLIDRGPGQLQILETVREMVDSGSALCIMGNHELNAIAYATPDQTNPGAFVRKHSEKNRQQHAEFLKQVGEGSQAHQEWVSWFRNLPLSLDLGGIRVVHACWNDGHIETLANYGLTKGYLDDEQIHWAFDKRGGHPAYTAIDHIAKGPEVLLPEGLSFTDHAGHVRRQARIRWWLPDSRYLHEIAITDGHESPDIIGLPIPNWVELPPVEGPPIFIGHYWLSGQPTILSSNVACLDYSAAGGGPLVGYRWEGESLLTNAGFVAS